MVIAAMAGVLCDQTRPAVLVKRVLSICIGRVMFSWTMQPERWHSEGSESGVMVHLYGTIGTGKAYVSKCVGPCAEYRLLCYIRQVITEGMPAG